MITLDMKVADVFENYPATHLVFQKFGFGALTNPILRNTFGKITTVEKGCRMHGVPVQDFLNALNLSLTEPLEEKPNMSSNSIENLPKEELEKLERLLNLNIQEIVHRNPEVKKVFMKYFGEGCFSCPSFGREDVRFACSMHNTNPIVFAKDCLSEIKEAESIILQNQDTIRDIVRKYPATMQIFYKYGLDSCCGGEHSIEKAATAHKIDLQDLKKELLSQIKSG